MARRNLNMMMVLFQDVGENGGGGSNAGPPSVKTMLSEYCSEYSLIQLMQIEKCNEKTNMISAWQRS